MVLDMRERTPRDYAGNVERQSHVDKNEDSFKLDAVERIPKSAKAISSDVCYEELVDLGDTAYDPNNRNVVVESFSTERCLVHDWFDDRVPSIYGQEHDG